MAELEEAEDAFEVEAVAAAAAAGSRSELLPDIEEINSTLRATGDRSEAEADASDAETLGSGARRRGKTRRGFFLVVLLAVIGVLLYMYAPELSEAVPQLAGVMDSYVEAVNAARFWLDDMARSLASGTSGTPEG